MEDRSLFGGTLGLLVSLQGAVADGNVHRVAQNQTVDTVCRILEPYTSDSVFQVTALGPHDERSAALLSGRTAAVHDAVLLAPHWCEPSEPPAQQPMPYTVSL